MLFLNNPPMTTLSGNIRLIKLLLFILGLIYKVGMDRNNPIYFLSNLLKTFLRNLNEQN